MDRFSGEAKEPKALFQCDNCGEWIAEHQGYYETDESLFCKECAGLLTVKDIATKHVAHDEEE